MITETRNLRLSTLRFRPRGLARFCGVRGAKKCLSPSYRLAPAFTLTELLISIAIIIILVLFLSQIFAAVRNTVTLGIATSDIIQHNLAFTQQVGQDAEAITGPTDSGFIVLLQKKMDDFPIKLRPDDPQTSTSIRSDQIAFIRKRESLQPICPGDSSSFTPATSDATHVAVWYGHALRTNTDGLSAPDLGTTGPNLYASQWLLGRRALFLQLAPAGTHVNSALGYPFWSVAGWPAGAPGDYWYKGLSDVFDKDLDTIIVDLNTGAAFGAPTYPEGAWAFAYPENRLWCNPQTPDLTLQSWQVAQMHPYFMSNVSDLRIDFAGDFDGVLGIDTNLLNGRIKWYSHFGGDPGDEGTEPIPVGAQGFSPVALPVVPLAIYTPNPGVANADAAFVWRPLGLDWPKMIRFRYRLHDKRGLITDRDGYSGKLFERIVKIQGATLPIP